jgi:hypothetical protein
MDLDAIPKARKEVGRWEEEDLLHKGYTISI